MRKVRRMTARTIGRRCVAVCGDLGRIGQETWEALKTVMLNLVLIAVGSAMCAVAINGILVPFEFQSGGFVGLALIVHYFFPGMPVSLLYLALNIPVFALGWKYVGRRFFLYSCAGTLIFTLMVQWVQMPVTVNEKMLAAILAGALSGLGGGILLKSFGSAGGMDILSIILLKQFSIRLGTGILVLNSLILVSSAVLFSVDTALYSMIYIYVTTKMLNLVFYGLSQRKAVTIISAEWPRIQREIIDGLHRGVTILNAKGGYTGKETPVLFSVVTFQEMGRLKKMVYDVDPTAFLVVNDTLEVMGSRIGNQPHW